VHKTKYTGQSEFNLTFVIFCEKNSNIMKEYKLQSKHKKNRYLLVHRQVDMSDKAVQKQKL